MRGFRTIAIGALAQLALFSGASGVLADWQVVRASGQVFIGSNDVTPIALSSGETVPDGASISTGRRSRALLSSGSETVAVGPNTVITLPAASRRMTTVVQHSGSIEVDVTPGRRPRFTVETPFLAAVVKGTRFTVDVSRREASVSVDHGLVQVTDVRTGQSADVGAGMEATVSAAGGFVVDGGNGATPTERSPNGNPATIGNPGVTIENAAINPGGYVDPGLGGIVGGVVGTTVGVVESVVPGVGGVVGTTVGVVDNTVEQVTGLAEGVTAPVTGVVDTVAPGVGSTVDGVVGGLGNTLNGLLGN